MFRVLLFASFLIYCAAKTASLCGNKEGICPFKNTHWPRKKPCPIKRPTCSKDTDCPGEAKCCEDPKLQCLFKRCMGKKEVLQAMIKPGECPKKKRIGALCDFFECKEDAHCKGDKKCCKNGCGSDICMDPVNAPKPLQCPYRVPRSKNCTKNRCNVIRCPRKCCWDGCQNFCI